MSSIKLAYNSQVQLISVMGTDLTVVNSARVSFDKESKYIYDDDDKAILDRRDENLIKFLAEHNHWTPFSHPQLTFRIDMPLAIARQWFKHTVGLTRNEISRRYVSDPPTYFCPNIFRQKDENKKQGSRPTAVENNEELLQEYIDFIDKSNALYEKLLDKGVCPEQARFVLPTATMTSFYETGSLYAYSRIVNLRDKSDAQKEIQDIAKLIKKYLDINFPISTKYLCNKNNV